MGIITLNKATDIMENNNFDPVYNIDYKLQSINHKLRCTEMNYKKNIFNKNNEKSFVDLELNIKNDVFFYYLLNGTFIDNNKEFDYDTKVLSPYKPLWFYNNTYMMSKNNKYLMCPEKSPSYNIELDNNRGIKLDIGPDEYAEEDYQGITVTSIDNGIYRMIPTNNGFLSIEKEESYSTFTDNDNVYTLKLSNNYTNTNMIMIDDLSINPLMYNVYNNDKSLYELYIKYDAFGLIKEIASKQIESKLCEYDYKNNDGSVTIISIHPLLIDRFICIMNDINLSLYCVDIINVLKDSDDIISKLEYNRSIYNLSV